MCRRDRAQRRGFQCSSASRKFLNTPTLTSRSASRSVSVLFSEPKIPQCGAVQQRRRSRSGFSALQRAENSSMRPVRTGGRTIPRFQCSSASRKFLNSSHTAAGCKAPRVSVLFSEPKIPQYEVAAAVKARDVGFSALQRAENSSIARPSAER